MHMQVLLLLSSSKLSLDRRSAGHGDDPAGRQMLGDAGGAAGDAARA